MQNHPQQSYERIFAEDGSYTAKWVGKDDHVEYLEHISTQKPIDRETEWTENIGSLNFLQERN
jgi:hypothetical protein